jgi:hypothetical protein
MNLAAGLFINRDAGVQEELIFLKSMSFIFPLGQIIYLFIPDRKVEGLLKVGVCAGFRSW